MVAVEVGQEDGFDGSGVEPEPVHMWQHGGSTVEQQPAVHHDRTVVPLEGEGGSGAQEG